MKVLIIGPSGSGKTFVAKALQQAGINTFDADDIEGLSNWYDQSGKKVAAPSSTANEALNNRYAFLWSRKFLADFLGKFSEVYLFGGSGNVSDLFDLFDKVYFLKIDPDLQKERLKSPLHSNPLWMLTMMALLCVARGLNKWRGEKIPVHRCFKNAGAAT